MRTEEIVSDLKELPNGWKGAKSKKPASKAVRKAKQVLTEIETSRMPWPEIIPISDGSLVFTWGSTTRDIVMTIDVTGDIQFMTSLKVLSNDNFEVIDRLNSEGRIADMKTLDHMMAWYMADRAGNC